MIKKVLGALALSATALTTACAPAAVKCDGFDQNCGTVSQSDAEDVTGFVPLISPALGILASGAGLAVAAGGGGSATSTTSTTD